VIVPIAQYQSRVATSSRVQDLAHRLDGSFDVASVWLSSTAD
jgi:hypothetical protein